MTPLYRHQLAWLHPQAWQRIVASQGDAIDEACLRHWAAHDLPVVVTRQPQVQQVQQVQPAAVALRPHAGSAAAITAQTATGPAGAADVAGAGVGAFAVAGDGLVAVTLAIAAPSRWGRRRLAFPVQPGDIRRHGDFPPVEAVLPLLAESARGEAVRLGAALSACGAVARVYGSHGWQALTGLDHLQAGSDLDLWVAVADEAQADTAAAVLEAAWPTLPRLDGELCFPDGSAVAWREWRDWRAGRVRAVLVKSLRDCRLRWSPV